MNSRKFPQIDQTQARRQLELLGYQWGDKVFLRFFYPSNDPRKIFDKGRKSDRLKIEQIEANQREGRGVYFVVNGGGHKNDDVQFGRAFFIEHDHLPKEVQRELWRELKLPEPTLQIDTGGISIHSYWVLQSPIPIALWRKLQRDLLEYSDADRSIKNPSRVMRLAGGWHISINGEGNPVYQQTQIISDSGKKYSYEELRAIVPERMENSELRIENDTTPTISQKQDSSGTESQRPQLLPKHPDEIQIPVPQPVPLLECCRKEVREWVKTGVPQGQKRNDIAINVGLELVAVERYLQKIGQAFTDTARQLFTEYCRFSGMTVQEDQERWHWCETKNPNPSCGPDGINACIRGWYWREHVKNSELRTQNSELRTQKKEFSANNKIPHDQSKTNGKGSESSPNSQQPNSQQRETEINVRKRLQKILAQDYSPPELTEAFNKLSQTCFWSVREIRLLAEEMDDNFEQEYSRKERFAQLKKLRKYKRLILDLYKFLPHNYAQRMTQMSKWMEVPTAAFLTAFLPMFFSCLHPATRMVVKECIGFIEPPIIYSGIVTESGQRKSPLINALADPLKELQAEEDQRWREEEAQYNQEYAIWQSQKEMMSKEEWKDAEPTPPQPRREFFLDKTTIENIDQVKGRQPDTGFIWLKDELSSLFNGYNAYKKGKGDDKESVLSSWNGRGVKKNLKGGERVFVKHDSMSIFGAIQDVTLQKKMGNFDDEQGEWARFLWCLMPLKPLRLPKEDTSFYLAFLKDLYQKARDLAPQSYRFTSEAQEIYDEYHWQLEMRRTNHPQRGMRAAISKMEGYTARLAMGLYLIWVLETGNEPIPYVPKRFVEAAIMLSEFYLSQVNLIHSDGAASLGEGGLTPRLNVILDKLQHFGELTARKVQSTVNYLRKEKASVIRQDFIELAKLGYGKLVGTGNKLRIVLNAVTSAVGNAVDAVAAKIVNQHGLQTPSSPTAVAAVASAVAAVKDETVDQQGFQPQSSKTAVASAVASAVGNEFAETQDQQELQPSSNSSAVAAVGHQQSPDLNFVKTSDYQDKTEKNDLPLEVNDASPPDNHQVLPEINSVSSEESLDNHVVNSETDSNNSQVRENDLSKTATEFNANGSNSTNSSNSTSSLNADWEEFLAADPWAPAAPAATAATADLRETKKELTTEHSLDETEVSSSAKPSLEELKALLMACKSLAELKKLKQDHDNLNEAYKTLTQEQQLKIDGIAATDVPYEVFKYTGESIEQNGHVLKTGQLVYIEPDAQIPKSASLVPVWLMRGIQLGWRQSVSVIKDYLVRVEKAVMGESGNLADGRT